MRRKDRETTDMAKINKIIQSCHCCRLGLYDQGKVYIVPLNFGYWEENQKRIFYFHSAMEGRKIDLIAKNQYAGFELDTNYKLHPAPNACSFSAGFQSIIGSGKVSFVTDEEEKKLALKKIMLQNTGTENWSFTDSSVKKVCVIRLDVEEISCKEHL